MLRVAFESHLPLNSCLKSFFMFFEGRGEGLLARKCHKSLSLLSELTIKKDPPKQDWRQWLYSALLCNSHLKGVCRVCVHAVGLCTSVCVWYQCSSGIFRAHKVFSVE